jgi:hypothetical protein
MAFLHQDDTFKLGSLQKWHTTISLFTSPRILARVAYYTPFTEPWVDVKWDVAIGTFKVERTS